MANANFKVVITGEVASDFEYSHVVNTAARLFKCTPAQAQKLLCKHPTTLKRVKDKATALRYCQQLLKAGIVCRVENEGESAAAVTGKKPLSRPIPKDSATQALDLMPNQRSAQQSIPAINPALVAKPQSLSLEPIEQPHDHQPELNPAPPAPRAPAAKAPPAMGLSIEPVISQAAPQATEPPAAVPPPQVTRQNNVAANPQTPINTGTNEIVCPKCRTKQRVTGECANCGIVFSKFVGDRPVPQSQEQEVNEEELQSELWDELAWFIGEHFEAYRLKFADIINNDDRFVPQWHWPAFLVPYAWFIHRKLYTFFAGYIAYFTVMTMFGVMPFVSALIGNTLCALGANYVLYRHAMSKIEQCSDDPDSRRIDIIEAGQPNSIFVTLGSTLAMILFVWMLIFNFLVRPMVNAMLDTVEQDQAFIQQGKKSDAPTKLAMIMLKNVVIGTSMAKHAVGEKFEIPKNMDQLRHALELEPAAADLQFKDSWGNPLQYSADNTTITIESSGADGKWDSDDDIVLNAIIPEYE